MHEILNVKLIKKADNWKDNMAGYHEYQITTKCLISGKVIVESVHGTENDCKQAVIHYPECELCNPNE